MILKTIIPTIFLIQTLIYSQIYYVDSYNGNDLNNGLSQESAWKSIEQISYKEFQPGTKILFKKNSIWREELRIPSSGSIYAKIVFDTYGDGAAPKILGSSKIDNWINYSPKLWKAKFFDFPGWLWYVKSWNNIIWGNKVENSDSLLKNFDFFIHSNYIHIFSEENPNIEFQSIEASVRDFGIISGWYSEGKSHISINGIEIAFTKIANLRAVGSTNWKVSNIISHHSGAIDESDGQGIQFEGSNSEFSNNTLFENGQHGFFLSAFGNKDVIDIVIEKNRVYNNYHTGIDIMNLGGREHGLKNITIRYNYIYDTQSHSGKEIGIQLLAYPPGKIIKSNIYYNIVHNVKGIAFAIFPEVDSVEIFNNTAYEPESACFLIDGGNGNIKCNNNIGVGNKYYLILSINKIKNKTINNNLWFRNHGTIAFVNNIEFRTWESYTNTTDFDKQSFNFDPMFVDANKYDFKLSEKSKCIDKGIETGIKYDFYGNPTIGKPDIGAVEFIE